MSRELARRLARLEEGAAAAAAARAGGDGAREELRRRLAALAARMRAHRGDRPLTPGEEAKASIAELAPCRPHSAHAERCRGCAPSS